MARRRGSGLVAGAGLIALAIAIPVFGQSGQGPASILPPGFGDASPPPPPVAVTPAPPPPAATDAVPAITLTPQDLGLANGQALDALDNATEVVDEAPSYDVPDERRREVDGVGLVDDAPDGLGSDAFGRADGVYLSALLRALDAPIASRWASIMLRRALLTRTATPPRIDGADWIAERSWLLLRMGEADAARMLVDQVDVDRYTPKLLSVATQSAFATADPAALCPLTDIAKKMSKEPAWPLARAMCAALSGEPGVAGALIDQARASHVAKGVDLLLAEKVIGAGSNGRRAINIQWDAVEQLTGWRFGMASALAVPIPDRLYDTVGPHVRAWSARAPELTPEARMAPARTAAALGVFSNAALVDLYGAVADRIDPAKLDASDAGQLRIAYVERDSERRMAALRQLWGSETVGIAAARALYGGEILTARACALIPPDKRYADDIDRIVGAMYAAGLDLSADRWRGVVDALSGAQADRAWSIMAVGAPDRAAPDAGRITGFVKSVDPVRARLFVAALGGLGRVNGQAATQLAGPLGLNLGRQDVWTRALDRAVAGQQKGTVAVLAAVGMQTQDWRGVDPAHFYRLIGALAAVGMDGEARMIAAEAMSRT